MVRVFFCFSVCICLEGKDVIKQGRQMLGETQPLASKPGSIRGDYSIGTCMLWIPLRLNRMSQHSFVVIL